MGEHRAGSNQVETTFFLCLTTYMNHQSETRERSTKIVQQGPQNTISSHHSLTKPHSLLHPSSIYILSLFSLLPVPPCIHDSFHLQFQIIFFIFPLLPLFIICTIVNVRKPFLSHLHLLQVIKPQPQKTKTQWRFSGRHTLNTGDESEHMIFGITSEKAQLKHHRLLFLITDM